MLKTYTNQSQILKTSNAIQGSRLESTDLSLLPVKKFAVTLKSNKDLSKINIPSLAVTPPRLELHVYTLDGIYLTGDQSINYTVGTNKGYPTISNLEINLIDELESLGINRGQYKIVHNFLDESLGLFDSHKLWIREISPSRRELRLQFSETESKKIQAQYEAFVSRLNTLDDNKLFDSFVLNFGKNEIYQIVNLRTQEDVNGYFEIVVKLYAPLPAKYGEKQQLWICEEIIAPWVDTIDLVAKVTPPVLNKIAGPNFDLEELAGQSVATSYKTWTDLLSTNVQTSQQLIDSYFSGSLSGVDLNVNYNDFENFVHFSNATERIKNFYYKLQLIESYTDSIQTLLDTSGSEAIVNLEDTYRKRNAVVSGFDGFEKYLFFESTGSRIYTHLTSSYDIQPWPKQSITGQGDDAYDYFYKNVATDSATGLTYYYDLLDDAEIFDRNNLHSLINTVPQHILDDENNEEFSTFVYMLGQHFDILWSYVKHLTSINSREEHPKDGMSSDLLYHVAKSQGFQLLNGRSAHDLWKYSLGTDASGSNANLTQSTETTTKELWRRLVNNLPYILKSKGSSRSIKALLACYGIPTTILTIKEYGGPSTFTDGSHYPQYVHDVFHYSWLSSGSLKIASSSYNNGYGSNVTASTVQFRFKSDNNYSYNPNVNYLVFSTTNNNTGSYGYFNSAVTVNRESVDNNDATIKYIVYDYVGNARSASISNVNLFDNSWHNVVVSYSGSTSYDTYKLHVVKSLYGKTVYHYSSSVSIDNTTRLNNRLPLSEDLIFSQDTITKSNKWFGHYQEIRLWSGSLNDATIEEHAHSPNTYTFNVDRLKLISGNEALDPYYHLLQRFNVSTKTIYSGSFFQKSVHPNQTVNTSSVLYFNGYSNSGSITFEGFEETYYTPSPSLAGNSLYADKVRIESSSLDPNATLSSQRRVEKSSFDRYSLDSNRVGIYFSPQNAINEDIFNQLGYFEIDDYIGDPGDLYEDKYEDLVNFSRGYWKKYENKNDFEAYFRALEIYDFTVFKYIKRLLPERVNPITGLLIEPNVLERSRIRTTRPSVEELSIQALIDDPNPVLSGTKPDYDAVIDDPNPILTGTKPDYDAVIDDPNPTLISEYLNNEGTIQVVSASLSGLYTILNTAYNMLPTPGGEYMSASLIDPAQPIDMVPDFDTSYNTVLNGNVDYSYNDKVTSTYTSIDSTLDASFYNFYETFRAEQNKTSKLWASSSNTGFRILTGSGNRAAMLEWPSKRLVGNVWLPYKDSYTPVGLFIDGQRVSKKALTKQYFYSSAYSASIGAPYSSSYKLASVQDSQALGQENMKFNGSKLTGPGININSSNTVDGGPVIKVTKVNKKKIVFSKNQPTTIDSLINGPGKKSI